MDDLTYKFEVGTGSAREYQGNRYLQSLLVVAVVPAGQDTLVVLTKPGIPGIPDVIRVIKVARYHRLTAIMCLAEARSSPRWDCYRKVLFRNQVQEA